MKRVGGCLKLLGAAVLIFLIVAGGLFGYGLYYNTTKSLEQTQGDATSLALVDQEALTALLDEANRTRSDAIVILKDGELVGAWHTFGKERQLESMSMTKSIMNLLVGRAYTMGYIESLDEPMSTYFPEWAEEPYSDITLRHVLGHSSGIGRALGYEYFWRSDMVEYGLTSPVLATPGTRHQYSNRTSNLLPAVIEKATGQSADAFARDHLLHPMGITDYSFQFDRVGNMVGASGFHVLPYGNAQLGQLVLDRGWFDGQSLIDETWFDMSLTPSTESAPFFGLSWWLDNETTYVIDEAHLAHLKEIGASDDLVNKLQSIAGTYDDSDAFEANILAVLGDDAFSRLVDELGASYLVARHIPQELRAFAANGDLGQHIIGVPSSGIVAVRMYEDLWPTLLVNYSNGAQYGFRDFNRYVFDLAE